MEYTAPVVEVIGPASELIQNDFGPWCDGDGFALSMGGIISPLEEDEQE